MLTTWPSEGVRGAPKPYINIHCYLCRTYGRILDFSFGGRTENRYEMAFELVSGAGFRGVLHHLSILTRLKACWGQVCPESGPKPAQNTNLYFGFLI